MFVIGQGESRSPGNESALFAEFGVLQGKPAEKEMLWNSKVLVSAVLPAAS